MRPSRTATSSASGTEAAEVLPCLLTVTTTWSIDIFKLARGCRDDADIGLVRHQPVDIRFLHVIRGKGFIDDAAERVDRHFEHFVTAHFNEGLAFLDLLVAVADAVRHPQQVFVLAIGVDVAGEHPGFIVGAQDYRAGAVAEQHAGAAILPVQDARKTSAPTTSAVRALPDLMNFSATVSA